jgi:hypothetical protein
MFSNPKYNTDESHPINKLKDIKYNNIYAIFYEYENNLNILKCIFPDINIMHRFKLNYWFFSKIITNLYLKEINYSERKYDILIA